MKDLIGEMTDRGIRHVYGNGGIRKVQALALCMRKGRVENVVGFGFDYHHFHEHCF